MDMERIKGALFSGFMAKLYAASIAVYIASYAAIALCDALERVSMALPK